jgi:adenylate kinase
VQGAFAAGEARFGKPYILNSGNTAPPAPALILFGPPGSGKGTQSKLLQQSCIPGPHISTGDMLRRHIEAGDEIGLESERLIKAGKLVPDEMVNQLVELRLAAPDCRAGMILDGYPRTLNQAKVLLDLLARYGYRPAVVHLVVDRERIVRRLSGRRICPVCGTLYSLKTNPPKVPGICDLDGAELVTREDDRESVIRERLAEYETQTRPLLDYFRQEGVPVFEISGASATPEQISNRICSELRAAGLAIGRTEANGVVASDAGVRK